MLPVGDYIVPIQPSLSQQSNNSSTSYRYSGQVEQGDYSGTPRDNYYHFHNTINLPAYSTAPTLPTFHSQSSSSHTRSHSQSSGTTGHLGTLQSTSLTSQTSNNQLTSGHSVSRSLSLATPGRHRTFSNSNSAQHSTGTRMVSSPPITSNHNLAYSPGSHHSSSTSSSTWPSIHNPHLVASAATTSSSTGQPMTRGLSHDGTLAQHLYTGASAGDLSSLQHHYSTPNRHQPPPQSQTQPFQPPPPATASLQTVGLLPTSYSGGRIPSGTAPGHSPMVGVQQSPASPSHHPPYEYPGGQQQFATPSRSSLPPMSFDSHDRQTSYSPSRYATGTAGAYHHQQAPPPPPPLASSYNSVSSATFGHGAGPGGINGVSAGSSNSNSTPTSTSFYAHHIPAQAGSVSGNMSAAGQTLGSRSPQPPGPSRTPAHHPQAQQYYQSQQYLDSNYNKRHSTSFQSSNSAPLGSASATTSPAALGLGMPGQGHSGAHPEAAYYAGGQNFAAGAGGQAPVASTSASTSPASMTLEQSTATATPSGDGRRSSSSRQASRSGRPNESADDDQRTAPPSSPVEGLRRVRDVREIPRANNPQPRGRRADPAGGFVSPLKGLTTHLPQTYQLVNPSFRYETSLNPRRVLTKPSKPAQNDGFDNEDSDYILYVNDVLGPEDKDRYLILDVLGQGTFGQVVKCQNMKTHEIVAVKVVKNKPAYFQQSMMEVTILELINNQWDKDDEHHMLRLKDTFIHHSHLCLVFELLSNNLYELIKQNSFRGLTTSLVRVFTAQLLDALTVLNEAKIIHCDLKPENILLKSLSSPTIKVIDFGSACHEKQTVYTYIQSRFYRSPEVIISLPYATSIDMWSLGCICVELFLGLPLFPGTSEFNQITRIVEMLGMPPDHMLDKGKQTAHFFDQVADEYGRRRWRLKSLERYAAEFKVQEQPSKKYFAATTLPEIIKQYPIQRKGLKEADVDKEMKSRVAFIDFVKGLLHLDPEQRWTPQQARLHPFVLGEPLLAPFVPPPHVKSYSTKAGSGSSPNPKQPYGGLPPAPQSNRASRTYDAKSYSQHLSQQQQYTVQAQQAAQRQAQIPTNPYQQQHAPPVGLRDHPQQQQSTGGIYQRQGHGTSAGAGGSSATVQGGVYTTSTASSSFGYPGGAGPIVNPPPAAHAAHPHQHYSSTTAGAGSGRGRSGTVELPPALQRFGRDLSVPGGTGQSVTPVLNREDQWRAWERQVGGDGSGGVQRRISISTRNPHLNLLQEQAESGLHPWNSPIVPGVSSSAASVSSSKQPPAGASSGYYQQQQQSPMQGQLPQFSVVVDSRGQPQSQAQAQAQYHQHLHYTGPNPGSHQPVLGNDLFDPAGSVIGIAAPPLAYGGGGTQQQRYSTTGALAGSAGGPGQNYFVSSGSSGEGIVPPAPAAASFDAFDHRDGLGTLYQPMQPFSSQQQQQQQSQGRKGW